ncbi:hypothetical protein HPB48_005848 [Haemaphysalis longicornis]|uniref:Uncharacterized protein n=1 Tax=Haemaphysalis longicornis TaxID=44386 RepID=A0A9J6GLZ8_HAELO|nr:hypothetical protein HPB48_005848 [Haemaphysalis longicornis]
MSFPRCVQRRDQAARNKHRAHTNLIRRHGEENAKKQTRGKQSRDRRGSRRARSQATHLPSQRPRSEGRTKAHPLLRGWSTGDERNCRGTPPAHNNKAAEPIKLINGATDIPPHHAAP